MKKNTANLPREREPERQKTTVWLDKSLWKEAKIYAIQQGMDLQDLLADALRMRLGKKS